MATNKQIDVRNSILFTLVTAVVAALVFTPLGGFLNECMQRASTGWNVLGFVAFAASAASAWAVDKFNWLTAERARIIWIGGIAAGIVFSCGFNFNTFGTSQQ